jgi:transketolase
MAVGMAVAEELLRAQLGSDTIDHYTYCLCGDGDLQEPGALGAAQLAGHWDLSRLVMYYDNNAIQISGGVERVDSTVIDQSFKSYGWEVIDIDGHDRAAITGAIEKARSLGTKPTLIIGRTTMAQGAATMEGTPATHGSPLPTEEIAATKRAFGLDPKAFFAISDATYDDLRTRWDELHNIVDSWEQAHTAKLEDKEFAAKWEKYFGSVNLSNIDWPEYEPGQTIATRKAFGQVLDAAAAHIPSLVGGSADLEPSNNTVNFARAYSDFSKANRQGRSLAYGVREFPMAAINNGLALHGGIKPFDATFLVFTDYARPALRLRALQKLWALGVYTHDSIYVGEDGPTHQPVEHIMSLRMIPDLYIYRPAEGSETTACMQHIFGQADHPAALMLARQSVPVFDRSIQEKVVAGVAKGAYVVQDCTGTPDVTIFATGSEVGAALQAAADESLGAVRVISVPCWELFLEQPEDYQQDILGSNDGSFKVSLEAGVTTGWEKFTGNRGLNLGIDRFGASAPGNELAESLGFSLSSIVKSIKAGISSVAD